MACRTWNLSMVKKADITSADSRKALAKMVTKLFSFWGLKAADQLELLGMSHRSRSVLANYRNGAALPASRDTLDRVGWLLSIHKSLRIIFPYNRDLCYSWIMRRNKTFDNLRPLDVMKEQGIIGLARVARYLEFCMEQ